MGGAMNTTTTDLSKFGHRERAMAEELLHEWNKGNLPEDFYDDEVTIMMNTYSGNVFLTNSEFQVAMMNGDTLEMWYYCGECGQEGFLEDFPETEECDCEGCKEIISKRDNEED
jgi:DNA-directed RNA polymerase subunit RPC12/RpoP